MATWHDNAFFGMHYDLHASRYDTELGSALTEEHLRDRMQQIKPDWIHCDCKGHPGWTSWPTDIGSTSPGVVKDALKIHRTVTKEMGIKLGMHYSGVIDERATALHPEWLQIEANGLPNTRGITCRQSGYLTELMIPQMLELVEKYDVDGFWVDGENWGSKPCWCNRCIKAFREKTSIKVVPRKPEDETWHDWLAFHRQQFVDHVTAYANAIHEKKPECAVCSNWMYTVRQPEPISAPVDYLSGDYTYDWGSYRAALEGRMLDGRGRSWDLMVWGFSIVFAPGHEAQGIYQSKNAVHLKQEVAEVIALGGGLMIYVQPERNGRLVGWQHDVYAEVGDFARERKELCFKTASASEAAVLHPASSYYRHNDPLFNYGRTISPVEGALHALLENHFSTDLITEESMPADTEKYRLIVVPEREHLGAELVAQLRGYVAAGGHIVMSGSHLCTDYPELVGASFDDEFNRGRDDRFFALASGSESVAYAGSWCAVKPGELTEVLRYRLNSREPDDRDESWPAITRRTVGKGTVTAIHGPFFWNYSLRHYPGVRRLLRELIDGLDIDWKISLKAGPEIELIARKRKRRLLINLLNRGAGETLMPERVMIESLPPARDVSVKVQLAGEPARVLRQPGNQDAAWQFEAGVLTIDVHEVPIHEILEIVLD